LLRFEDVMRLTQSVNRHRNAYFARKRNMMKLSAVVLRVIRITAFVFIAQSICGQDSMDFLRDRGNGISTSLFGTYIERGNVIIYPFFFISTLMEYRMRLKPFLIHFKPWMFVRLNNAIGISPDATDIAPEVGIVFYLNKN